MARSRTASAISAAVQAAAIAHADSPWGRWSRSVGLAADTAHRHPPEHLLRAVRAALYEAKAQGRNCVSSTMVAV